MKTPQMMNLGLLLNLGFHGDILLMLSYVFLFPSHGLRPQIPIYEGPYQ
jgi:hypothetical protein